MPASIMTQPVMSSNVEQQLVGPNKRRIRVAFSNGAATALYVRLDSQGNSIGGFATALNTGPIEFSREKHGDTVCGAFWGLAVTFAQGNIAILETIE